MHAILSKNNLTKNLKKENKTREQELSKTCMPVRACLAPENIRAAYHLLNKCSSPCFSMPNTIEGPLRAAFSVLSAQADGMFDGCNSKTGC